MSAIIAMTLLAASLTTPVLGASSVTTDISPFSPLVEYHDTSILETDWKVDLGGAATEKVGASVSLRFYGSEAMLAGFVNEVQNGFNDTSISVTLDGKETIPHAQADSSDGVLVSGSLAEHVISVKLQKEGTLNVTNFAVKTMPLKNGGTIQVSGPTSLASSRSAGWASANTQPIGANTGPGLTTTTKGATIKYHIPPGTAQFRIEGQVGPFNGGYSVAISPSPPDHQTNHSFSARSEVSASADLYLTELDSGTAYSVTVRKANDISSLTITGTERVIGDVVKTSGAESVNHVGGYTSVVASAVTSAIVLGLAAI